MMIATRMRGWTVLRYRGPLRLGSPWASRSGRRDRPAVTTMARSVVPCPSRIDRSGPPSPSRHAHAASPVPSRLRSRRCRGGRWGGPVSGSESFAPGRGRGAAPAATAGAGTRPPLLSGSWATGRPAQAAGSLAADLGVVVVVAGYCCRCAAVVRALGSVRRACARRRRPAARSLPGRPRMAHDWRCCRRGATTFTGIHGCNGSTITAPSLSLLLPRLL
jgi:hypothetical protein